MKKKPPTKRQRTAAVTDHNMTNFLKGVVRVQCAAHKLDCALAEMKLYAGMIAPQKGVRK